MNPDDHTRLSDVLNTLKVGTKLYRRSSMQTYVVVAGDFGNRLVYEATSVQAPDAVKSVRFKYFTVTEPKEATVPKNTTPKRGDKVTVTFTGEVTYVSGSYFEVKTSDDTGHTQTQSVYTAALDSVTVIKPPLPTELGTLLVDVDGSRYVLIGTNWGGTAQWYNTKNGVTPKGVDLLEKWDNGQLTVHPK